MKLRYRKMGLLKNNGRQILYCCGLLLVLVVEGETLVVPQHKEKNCTYMITVETTCTWGAETSNHVSVRFGDTNSNDILVKHLNSKHLRKVDPLEPQVLDDMPRKPFQACMVDQFQVTTSCVHSPICYLYLKLTGNDDWRPGFAQVRVLESSDLSSNYFYFRRYLPRHVWHGSNVCHSEVTPFGLKKKRMIYGKCKMYPDLSYNESSTSETLFMGFEAVKAQFEGSEMGFGAENDGCKCAPNYTCNPCTCK